jgi:hypothetical protein
MFRDLVTNSKLTARMLVCLIVLATFSFKAYSQEVPAALPQSMPEKAPIALPNENKYPIIYIGADRFVAGEDLIMSLEVDDWRLSNISAIKSETGIQVSFTELIEALDFPIDQKSLTEYSGWYISENKTFEMQQADATNNLTVKLNNEAKILNSAHYQLLYSDFFIELSEVNNWFKLNAEVDFAGQRIKITPEDKLPIQLESERKKRRFSKFDSKAEATMPYLNRGYTIFSPQAFDLQANINQTDDRTTAGYSILGVREVLLHKASFFVTGTTEESLSTARLNFSKKSLSGGLFGPLNAKSYEFGDVTPVRVGNLATGRLSRGVKLSNVDLVRSVNNEVTNLVGAILPGWDVELYRNDILLDQRLDVNDGRYEFNDIALLYGTNNFELIFYGPQGQIIRENETRILSTDSLNVDKFNYAISINEINEPLLKDSTLNNTSDLRGYSLAAEYSYGFGKSSRLKVGHENVFGSESDSNLLSIGVNTSLFGNSLLNYNYAFNDLDERSFDVNFRTAIGEQSITASLSSNANLVRDSDEIRKSNSVRLSVNGRLYKDGNTSIAQQTRISAVESDNSRTLRLTNNLGVSIGRTYVFHGLEYISKNGTESNELFGDFGVQHSFSSVFSKFQLRYSDTDAGLEFNNATADLSWVIAPNIKARLTHVHSIVDDNHRSTFNIDWRKDWWSLSARIINSAISGWQAGLYARMSFSGTPEYDSFINSNRGLTNRGSLLVRVFLDENGDLTYNEGEELLPNVRIKSIQSRITSETKDNGIAELVGLIPNKATDIILDDDGFDNPYIAPVISGISIVPREGHIDLIDFPIVNASELDGELSFINKSGNKIPAAYVKIGLYDRQNKLVATTLSEFDGFYLFTQIKPGKYSIKIIEDSMRKFNISEQLNLTVSFDFTGSLVSGKDAVIQQYPQNSFYLVHHGSFPTRRALEVYWQLNGENLKRLARISKVTYDQKPGKSHYRLVLLKTPQDGFARNFCNTLLGKNVECSVSSITENVYPEPEKLF